MGKPRTFVVKAVNGKVLWNDPVLLLRCEGDKGLTLIARRFSGFKSTDEVVLTADPRQARFFRGGEGPRNALTGGHPGVWDVHVLADDGSINAFRMRNQGDARALCRWIEDYAAHTLPRPCAQIHSGALAEPSPVALGDAEQYRVYLANLCYRLSYLRGRQTVQEVDAEISAIVEEIQGTLRSGEAWLGKP